MKTLHYSNLLKMIKIVYSVIYQSFVIHLLKHALYYIS